MKNLLTFLLTVSVLVFLSGASASAQGKGPGGGPSVGQGHGQGGGHDQVKTGSDPKSNHDSHADWQTKFNERFQNDTAFATKIKNLLGGPGTTYDQVMAAEMGFPRLGEFMSVLHVSKNLDIPFADLKAKVLGSVSTNQAGQTIKTAPMSLGKAIQQLTTLTPDQSNDAAKLAEKQAAEDMQKTTTTASK